MSGVQGDAGEGRMQGPETGALVLGDHLHGRGHRRGGMGGLQQLCQSGGLGGIGQVAQAQVRMDGADGPGTGVRDKDPGEGAIEGGE